MILAITLNSSVQAEAKSKAKPKTQPKINITGNNNFDKEAVVQISGIKLDPILTAKEVKDHLQSTGYFEDIRVTQTANNFNIYLKEKTSWFVIPYYSSDSENKIYGVGAGKAGLWGQNGFAAGRYQFGNDDHELSLLINDDSFLNTPWVVGISFDYENSFHRIFNNRVVVDRFANYYYGTMLKFGYHLTPDLTVKMHTYIEHHRFEELSGSTSEGLQLSHRFLIDYGKIAIDEGLVHGTSTQAYFEFTNPLGNFQFYKFGTTALSDVYSAGEINWTIKPKFEVGSNLPRYGLFEIGGVKLRGYPSQYFRDSSYLSVQNNFLISSVTFWKFKLRPLIFADWAYIQKGNRESIGSGFLVYFKSVAVPTLELFAGYGLNPNGFSISATVGPQF